MKDRALEGRRILMVEDEALAAMVLEEEFAAAGADVLLASTADEALQLLNKWPIDAAVFDWSRYEVPVMLVANKAAELGVPLVFVTGYGEFLIRGRHTDVAVVSKPYDPRMLLSTVAGLFSGSG